MKGMKKTLGIGIVFALFLVGFSSAHAEINPTTELTAPETVSSTYPNNKWELLSLMGNGKLEPGTYEATFSENEINDLLEEGLSSLNMKWFIDSASVKINDGYVDISAHMLRPISGEMTARGVISIEDGKPVLKLSSAYYGFFPVPASFVERVGNFVMKKKSPSDWFSVKGVNWDATTFNDGELSFVVSVPEAQ